jgi:hypothetical protein
MARGWRALQNKGLHYHIRFSRYKDGQIMLHVWEGLGIFFNLHSGGSNQCPLDTAATNGQLCQPRVIMMMEKLVE